MVSKAKPLLDSRLFKQGELKLPRIFESVLSEASLKYAIWRALDSDKLTVSGEAELTGGIIDLLVINNDYSIGIGCKDRISETDKEQMGKYRTSGLSGLYLASFFTADEMPLDMELFLSKWRGVPPIRKREKMNTCWVRLGKPG